MDRHEDRLSTLPSELLLCIAARLRRSSHCLASLRLACKTICAELDSATVEVQLRPSAALEQMFLARAATAQPLPTSAVQALFGRRSNPAALLKEAEAALEGDAVLREQQQEEQRAAAVASPVLAAFNKWPRLEAVLVPPDASLQQLQRFVVLLLTDGQRTSQLPLARRIQSLLVLQIPFSALWRTSLHATAMLQLMLLREVPPHEAVPAVRLAGHAARCIVRRMNNPGFAHESESEGEEGVGEEPGLPGLPPAAAADAVLPPGPQLGLPRNLQADAAIWLACHCDDWDLVGGKPLLEQGDERYSCPQLLYVLCALGAGRVADAARAALVIGQREAHMLNEAPDPRYAYDPRVLPCLEAVLRALDPESGRQQTQPDDVGPGTANGAAAKHRNFRAVQAGRKKAAGGRAGRSRGRPRGTALMRKPVPAPPPAAADEEQPPVGPEVQAADPAADGTSPTQQLRALIQQLKRRIGRNHGGEGFTAHGFRELAAAAAAVRASSSAAPLVACCMPGKRLGVDGAYLLWLCLCTHLGVREDAVLPSRHVLALLAAACAVCSQPRLLGPGLGTMSHMSLAMLVNRLEVPAIRALYGALLAADPHRNPSIVDDPVRLLLSSLALLPSYLDIDRSFSECGLPRGPHVPTAAGVAAVQALCDALAPDVGAGIGTDLFLPDSLAWHVQPAYRERCVTLAALAALRGQPEMAGRQLRLMVAAGHDLAPWLSLRELKMDFVALAAPCIDACCQRGDPAVLAAVLSSLAAVIQHCQQQQQQPPLAAAGGASGGSAAGRQVPRVKAGMVSKPEGAQRQQQLQTAQRPAGKGAGRRQHATHDASETADPTMSAAQPDESQQQAAPDAQPGVRTANGLIIPKPLLPAMSTSMEWLLLACNHGHSVLACRLLDEIMPPGAKLTGELRDYATNLLGNLVGNVTDAAAAGQRPDGEAPRPPATGPDPEPDPDLHLHALRVACHVFNKMLLEHRTGYRPRTSRAQLCEALFGMLRDEALEVMYLQFVPRRNRVHDLWQYVPLLLAGVYAWRLPASVCCVDCPMPAALLRALLVALPRSASVSAELACDMAQPLLRGLQAPVLAVFERLPSAVMMLEAPATAAAAAVEPLPLPPQPNAPAPQALSRDDGLFLDVAQHFMEHALAQLRRVSAGPPGSVLSDEEYELAASAFSALVAVRVEAGERWVRHGRADDVLAWAQQVRGLGVNQHLDELEQFDLDGCADDLLRLAGQEPPLPALGVAAAAAAVGPAGGGHGPAGIHSDSESEDEDGLLPGLLF